jgi:hypothetical protein
MPKRKEKTNYTRTILHTADRELRNSNAQMPEQIVLLESDEVITVVFAHKITGVSKNGKEWSKWADKYKITFSCRSKNGTDKKSFNIYYWKKPQGHNASFSNVSTGLIIPPSFSDILHISPERRSEYKEIEELAMSRVFDMYERHFGKIINGEQIPRLLKNANILCYPLLQQGQYVTELLTDFYIAPALRTAFRKDTFQQATLDLFGKRKYRKDLVKAVAKTNPLALAFFAPFKTAVPIDWIITQLNKHSDHEGISTLKKYYLRGNYGINDNIKPIIDFMKVLPVNSQKALLNDVNFPYTFTQIMVDTARMYHDLQSMNTDTKDKYLPKDMLKAKTWKELHDRFVLIQRSIRFKAEPIPPTETAHKLEKVFTANDKYKIIAAKDTHELKMWGNEMGNCIGGYGNIAKSGAATLAKVMHNDKMIANIEIKEGICHQLYAKHNARLPEAQETEIIEAMFKAKVIKNEKLRYWT